MKNSLSKFLLIEIFYYENVQKTQMTQRSAAYSTPITILPIVIYKNSHSGNCKHIAIQHQMIVFEFHFFKSLF